jgi:hypothetical protein
LAGEEQIQAGSCLAAGGHKTGFLDLRA